MKSELFEATLQGDNDRILTLLTHHHDINQVDPLIGTSALELAAKYGHYSTFCVLVAKGAKLNTNSISIRNTMYYAVVGGNLNIITEVNKLGIPYDITFSDRPSLTLMIIAASCGHIKVMEFLNSTGLSYEPPSPRTPNPLEHAITYKRYDAVEFLLKKGVPTHPHSRIFVISNAISAKDEKLLDLFLNKYNLLKMKDQKDFRDLWLAAITDGHIDILDKLDMFSFTDKNKGVVLMRVAAQHAKVDKMVWLHKKGLAFDIPNKLGLTASQILLKKLGIYDLVLDKEFLKGLPLPETHRSTADLEKEALKQQIAKLQQEKNKNSEQIKYLMKENDYLQRKNAAQQQQEQTKGSTNGPTKKRLHEEDLENDDKVKIPRMS